MLLTDEGSISDDLSNLSDDADGYEAEEDDDHAVRACLHCLSVCCCARRRTAVAFSLDSGHDPGGYRHVRFELRMTTSGHVAAGSHGEERERVARAMCMCGASLCPAEICYPVAYLGCT